MNYRSTWNLASIPDQQWASEHGRRNAAKKPKKKVDQSTRAYLDRKAELMRRLRAERSALTK